MLPTATFPGLTFPPVTWNGRSQVHRTWAILSLSFSQSREMAGAPPPPALLTLTPALVPRWPCLGREILRARPGRSLAALLSLTAGQVREGSESGAGLPRGLWHCCLHPLRADFLDSTASPLTARDKSGRYVSLRRVGNSAHNTQWLPGYFCSLSAHS